MAFDVSALAAYVKDNEDTLIVKSLFDAKTQSLIQSGGTIMPEVSSAAKLPLVNTDAVFQAGGTCGFNASGTTTYSARTLTVGAIKVHEALCPKTLKAKYLQLKMKAGSQPTDIPFEKEYTDLKAGVIAEQMETAIWQGDTASGTAALARFDGLIKIIDAAGTAVDGNTGAVASGTGITQSNVRAIITAMWKALPAKVKGKKDVVIFCGWDVYEDYIAALIEANLYHYTAKNGDQEAGEILIPGTQYKLVAVHGLDDTNRIFAIRLSNMYMGTEIVGEDTKFELFHAKEADELRFMAEWKAGVQVAYPNEIVEFTLA